MQPELAGSHYLGHDDSGIYDKFRLLWQVGSVIRNAEVQALAPVLLAAIAEPNAKAKAALETLLNTLFVNAVDAASLALIVPVIHRGLRDRSGDAKKKAARIVGNMCELINEPKVHMRDLVVHACFR